MLNVVFVLETLCYGNNWGVLLCQVLYIKFISIGCVSGSDYQILLIFCYMPAYIPPWGCFASKNQLILALGGTKFVKKQFMQLRLSGELASFFWLVVAAI